MVVDSAQNDVRSDLRGDGERRQWIHSVTNGTSHNINIVNEILVKQLADAIGGPYIFYFALAWFYA